VVAFDVADDGWVSTAKVATVRYITPALPKPQSEACTGD
jgi:hypothetical protein